MEPHQFKPAVRFFDTLVALCVAAAWFGLISVTLDWGKPFEHDRDEGVNLIKAQLMARGHALYSDIWSDQPPVFSYILQAWNRAGLGQNAVESGRMLAAFFGAAMLGSFYLLLRKEVEFIPALAGVVCMAWSNDFLRLSHSVMIGLPSLAFAMGAWALLSRSQDSPLRASVAGLLFGLAMMTKMSALFFLPFILWGALGRKSLIWFLSSAAVTAWVIGFFSGSFSADHLTASHLKATHADLSKSLQFVGRFFRDDGELLGLGLLVWIVPRAYRPSRKAWLLPLIWVGAAAAILCMHSPVWYHHRLLITPGMAWFAAVGFGALLHALGANAQLLKATSLRIALCIVVLAAGRCLYKIPRAFEAATSDRLIEGSAILEKLAALKANSLYSPHAIFAVYGGWETPPELAVMTSKRLSSGVATEEWIIDRLLVHRPAQLLLKNKKNRPIPLRLQSDYSLVSQENGFAHLVLKSAEASR